MPETVRCPDCGAENDPAADVCAQCSFPLTEPGANAGPAAAPAAAEEPEFKFDPGPRPVRPRRARSGAMQPIQMQIWLFTGIAAVLGLVLLAGHGFMKSNARPVEGAGPEQQQRADAARQAIAKDSTNVDARIELANVLYDTGNWSEAIVHYRAALRMEPNRSTTVVDLGVCYYNLGAFAAAETLFQHALTLDPHQSVAMFNLGIIAENKGQWDEALTQFHRAMETGPPDAMKQVLEQHIASAMAKSGRPPPPLNR